MPFLLSGLVAGSVYGLSGMGITLTYRLSGIVNFAHGAVAMFCAFCFWQIHVDWGVPMLPALLLSMVALPGAMALVSERFVFRTLEESSVFSKTAATIGLFLTLYGAALFFFHLKAVSVPSLFPKGTVHLPGVVANWGQLGIIATVGCIAGLTASLLRFTTLGLNFRAVIDNPDLAEMREIPTLRVRRAAWILSYVMAAVTGLLVAPLFGSDPLRLSLVVIYSLVTVVIGRMVSLGWTMAGGIILALLDSFALGYLPQGLLTSRARGVLPFTLLLIGLVLGARHFASGSVGEGRSALLRDLGDLTRTKGKVPWRGLLLVSLAAGLIGTVTSEYWTFLLANAVGYALVFMSYKAFTSMTGMVSLAQAAFAGIGAFTAANFVAHGWPWPLAVAGAAVAAGLAGAVVAAPTVRLRGIFLALATLAFAQLVETVLFTMEGFAGGSAYGGSQFGRTLPRPWGMETKAYVWLLLGVFVVLGYLTDRLQASEVGEELQADLGSTVAAQSIGIRPDRGRLLGFIVAAGIAGIGGTMLSAVSGSVQPDFWNLINALIWLALAAVGGVGSNLGILAAALMLSFTPELVQRVPSLGTLYILVFGLAALIVLGRPGGLAAVIRSALRGDWRPVASRAPTVAPRPVGRVAATGKPFARSAWAPAGPGLRPAAPPVRPDPAEILRRSARWKPGAAVPGQERRAVGQWTKRFGGKGT